eukprot:1161491-Pelagomonas_calceolata.AAC.20
MFAFPDPLSVHSSCALVPAVLDVIRFCISSRETISRVYKASSSSLSAAASVSEDLSCWTYTDDCQTTEAHPVQNSFLSQASCQLFKRRF